jgi:catechol 2,3-dioxygenase-like lactoylglutathione lyase family enzyme
MITKLSHTSLFVLDQNKAYDFYINKLGFKVHTDATMENGYRWLTVTPPDQPDLEIILMPVLDSTVNGFDEESIKAFRTLLEKGLMGAGAWYTPNCRATYEELKAKGVDCTEPKEQFYGIESIIKDGCGNWFSMTEPKEFSS